MLPLVTADQVMQKDAGPDCVVVQYAGGVGVLCAPAAVQDMAAIAKNMIVERADMDDRDRT